MWNLRFYTLFWYFNPLHKSPFFQMNSFLYALQKHVLIYLFFLILIMIIYIIHDRYDLNQWENPNLYKHYFLSFFLSALMWHRKEILHMTNDYLIILFCHLAKKIIHLWKLGALKYDCTVQWVAPNFLFIFFVWGGSNVLGKHTRIMLRGWRRE